MSKKLPKTLEEELKHHDFPTKLLSIADYRMKTYDSSTIVSQLKRLRMSKKWHKGDPCQHCGIDHDNVKIGYCEGWQTAVKGEGQ